MDDVRPVPLTSGWISFGLGDVRPCDATYCVYADSDLPPLPVGPYTGEPHWLPPLAPDLDQRMKAFRPPPADRDRSRANLPRLATAVQRAGLELPPAFLRLMGSQVLQDRIPSCTACYFELRGQLLPCPGSEEAFMVSFLIDQQAVVTWYLVLTRNAGHCVVASSVHPVELAGDRLAQAQAVFIDDAVVCARSFEEFLYRFWLENIIYFALYDGRPLTDEQRRYVDFYRRLRDRQGQPADS